MLTALLYSHNFNPHHREGGDPGNPVDELEFKISIHTTAKVVTETFGVKFDNGVISIHTTAKVVTLQVGGQDAITWDFNPHHREGGDEFMQMLDRR